MTSPEDALPTQDGVVELLEKSASQLFVGYVLEELSFGRKEKDARPLVGGGQEHLDVLQLLLPVLHLDELKDLLDGLSGEILAEGLPRCLRQVPRLHLLHHLPHLAFRPHPRSPPPVT